MVVGLGVVEYEVVTGAVSAEEPANHGNFDNFVNEVTRLVGLRIESAKLDSFLRQAHDAFF